MTERLNEIFNAIPECNVFADVACDHGYIAREMLFSGKCKKVFVSDISEKSLEKARVLLKDYIESGRAESFVSDGFINLPKADVALVAGVGGALIVNMLKSVKSLPDRLVLQPMRNCYEVRKALVSLGYKIIRDFTFFAEGEFYDIICAETGKDFLDEEELLFGRTNIKETPQAFKDKMRVERDKLISYAQRENIGGKAKKSVLEKAERYNKYV